MFNEAGITDALNDLLINCGYKVIKIEYDEKHFGDFIIELFKEGLFKIRFVRDRGQLWCLISCNKSGWFLLTDIFFAIGVNFSYDFNDKNHYKSIELISKLIYQNFNVLRKSLTGDNTEITLQKTKEIKQERNKLFLRRLKGYKNN